MNPLDNDVVYAALNAWCRLIFRRSWLDKRCRRCGEKRYNHPFGRIRGCRTRRQEIRDRTAIELAERLNAWVSANQRPADGQLIEVRMVGHATARGGVRAAIHSGHYRPGGVYAENGTKLLRWAAVDSWRAR